jgi:hypothetical protein
VVLTGDAAAKQIGWRMPLPLPLVVQLGFAGSRVLVPTDWDGSLAAGFEDALAQRLAARLDALRRDLGLTTHFLCGISQIAIGADTAFTRACAERHVPQRIFLPQHREDFLNAAGESGPDFSPSQRAVARELLSLPHIIQECVVSDSRDRVARFEDVNLEIVDQCDILVCLVRKEAGGGPGGTQHAMDVATSRDVPVLEIEVAVDGTAPRLAEKWHGKERFRLPTAPDAVAHPSPFQFGEEGSVPDGRSYTEQLHAYASARAESHQAFFQSAAHRVIGAHLVATLLASVALSLHGWPALWTLLACEILFLTLGFGIHQYVHHTRANHVWAVARATAEITRSTQAVSGVRATLAYLLALPYPPSLKPLLRTLAVLHLCGTRGVAATDWERRRHEYVVERVSDQLRYYAKNSERSESAARHASSTFFYATLSAIVATSVKLLVVTGVWTLPPEWEHEFAEALGTLAIVLPVLAVAALSLAAALDREARGHTFEELAAFLGAQKARLLQARSEREFARLLLETESHLLGENATWLTRRSFTGLA